jgi:hypothetical protein
MPLLQQMRHRRAGAAQAGIPVTFVVAKVVQSLATEYFFDPVGDSVGVGWRGTVVFLRDNDAGGLWEDVSFDLCSLLVDTASSTASALFRDDLAGEKLVEGIAAAERLRLAADVLDHGCF